MNLLAAFDAETLVRHLGEVTSDGAVIIDSQQANVKVLGIPILPFEFKEQITEGLSWVGMNEVFGVVSYYQCGGVATGLLTRYG